MDVGIFYNRGTEGNAAVWYDASDTRFKLSETRDPFSNTTISQTSAANLTVGAFTTSELTIGAVAVSATGTELNYVDGVTSSIQTQLDTKIATTASASNDFVTFTRVNSNVNVVSANTVAVESRRAANNTLLTAEDTALQARIAANTLVAASNDFVTFTRLNANLNTTTANVAAVETRRAANVAGAISTVSTDNLTTSRALASDGSGKIV